MNNNKLIRDSSIELIKKKKKKSNQYLFKFYLTSINYNNKKINKNSQKNFSKNINNLYKYFGISKKKPKQNCNKIIDNILIRSTNNKENNKNLNIYDFKNNFINKKKKQQIILEKLLIQQINKINLINQIKFQKIQHYLI